MEQIVPGVNSPKDLISHVRKDDDMKINQPLYDTETGNFFSLEETTDFISVRRDADQTYFVLWVWGKK